MAGKKPPKLSKAASDDASDAESSAASETEDLDLEGKGGKKSPKVLFIAIGAVVLLLGAGAGVYFSGLLDPILGKDKPAEETATKPDHPPKKEAKKKESGGHGGKGGEEGAADADSPYLALPDLVVNLSSAQGQPRYLKLKVKLELEDPMEKSAVEAVAPRVIDHFQTYLRELRISDLRGSAGIYRLRQELLIRVNDAAAPVQVKDVLFQEILIQ